MSSTEQNENKILTEIACIAANGKFLSAVDRLRPAPEVKYASLHASGKDSHKNKLGYSRIQLIIHEYKKEIYNDYYFEPREIQYMLKVVERFPRDIILYNGMRPSPKSDENGFCTVRKINISRKPDAAKSKDTPWFINIENGTAKKDKGNLNSIQENSYKVTSKSIVSASDYAVYKFLKSIDAYISVFELTYMPTVIRSARNKYIEQVTNDTDRRANKVG